MAQGSSDAGLEAATGRHLDLPVAELARLLEMLGADGLQAFCLYLEHLEQVPGVDGELTLGVPHFSARWLLTASDRGGGAHRQQVAEQERRHPRPSGSGAVRAVACSCANPAAIAGQGARGRTWRAVLNPRLVVIRGGRDDLDELPQVRARPAAQERCRAGFPDFRGNRDAGTENPGSGAAEKQGVIPVSLPARKRETGTADRRLP